MGGAPQQPRTDFPGAEYFNLVPGRSIALGPRLANAARSTTVTVGAGTIGIATADLLLDPQFTTGAGVYIVRANTVYVPLDQSAEIQIESARLGLGTGGTAIFLDIAVPVSTLTSPQNAQVAMYADPGLIIEQDINGVGAGTGNAFPVNGPIFLSSNMNVRNNDATNPHQFFIQTVCVWHRLSGFVA